MHELINHLTNENLMETKYNLRGYVYERFNYKFHKLRYLITVFF